MFLMPHLLFEPLASGFIGHGKGRTYWLKPLDRYTVISSVLSSALCSRRQGTAGIAV